MRGPAHDEAEILRSIGPNKVYMAKLSGWDFIPAFGFVKFTITQESALLFAENRLAVYSIESLATPAGMLSLQLFRATVDISNIPTRDCHSCAFSILLELNLAKDKTAIAAMMNERPLNSLGALIEMAVLNACTNIISRFSLAELCLAKKDVVQELIALIQPAFFSKSGHQFLTIGNLFLVESRPLPQNIAAVELHQIRGCIESCRESDQQLLVQHYNWNRDRQMYAQLQERRRGLPAPCDIHCISSPPTHYDFFRASDPNRLRDERTRWLRGR